MAAWPRIDATYVRPVSFAAPARAGNFASWGSQCGRGSPITACWGARPEIGGDKRGAAGLHRYFSGANGEFLELFEWDTSLGGGAYLLDPTRLTEKVNNRPAALTILQSRGGKAFSILSWDQNRRHIELSIDRNVRAAGYAHFIGLAESLPPASPADPNAPIPAADFPPPFGPGIPFPLHPPN